MFCPSCGAPQLRVQVPDGVTSGLDAQPVSSARADHEIQWPAAVRAAAFYALPTGILFSLFSIPIINMLWIVAGAMWTIRRYFRKARPTFVLSAASGGRIGMLLGLFAALVSTACEAGSLLVQRFLLHSGAVFDAGIRAQVEHSNEMLRASNPDSAAQYDAVRHILLAPAGIGALLLFSMLFSATAVLFFGWLGGRLGTRWQTTGRARL